jgi:hypothetical protein
MPGYRERSGRGGAPGVCPMVAGGGRQGHRRTRRGNGLEAVGVTSYKRHSARGATLVRPHRYAGSPTRS